MKQALQKGFTLVELAIVLVIIGLLVGGVLVAQDLIKAAEIRAVSSDIERYNTGAAAFRTKYNGVPGDLVNTTAASFGMPRGDGGDGEGDGDGVLENNATTKSGFGGENLLFWQHLSFAQFIPFGSTQYSGATGGGTDLAAVTTAAFGTVATANAALVVALPQLRIRETGFIHAFGIGGNNQYVIGSFYTNGDTNGALTAGTALSPREALGVDEKVDDGNPTTGIARAAGGALASMTSATVTGGTATPAAGNCYDSDAPTVYATATDDVANAVGCSMRIRAGF